MRIATCFVNNVFLNNSTWTVIRNSIRNTWLTRTCSSKASYDQDRSQKFETVFSFPFVRHIATLNRMKLYHIMGTSLAVPGCGLLETLSVLPEYSFVAASYIGVTGAILFSLASLPLNNAIGFLYISEDNKQIKISSVDFWGRRRDRIVSANEWTPLLDMKPKTMDAIYLSPELTDGTKYKLFIKFGKVLNSIKMGQVIE
ncbi:transmembrane protein 186 [Leguminivora glycinivorella]|uniref:transmembrane protein 186 n=1 Tax=Leguminivora glycinivorella TaxID=1035111 RepID=UPI0020106276|nr:transmembrane protein 186 [Leguminivora glycinivorella]